MGKALLDVGRVSVQTGLYVPSELTLLGKTLLQLDQVGKILSPTFNPNESIRENVARIMSHRMLKNASPGKLFGSFLEMKDFVGGLPERINGLLDAAAGGDLRVNVKTPDAHHLLNGFEKIANRITIGMILASLIIGATHLMRVNTPPFEIFGYPGTDHALFPGRYGRGGKAHCEHSGEGLQG
jgi:ubiquinone biosynthesis protein